MNPVPATYAFKDGATIILAVLVLVRCVYDAVLWFREERTWHHFRVPNFEGVLGEEDTKCDPMLEARRELWRELNLGDDGSELPDLKVQDEEGEAAAPMRPPKKSRRKPAADGEALLPVAKSVPDFGDDI